MAQKGGKDEVRRSEKAADAKHGHAAPAADNRLKRDTPFLATLRFKNDLPEIPSDPKLLVAQADAIRLSAFSLTCLEKEPKRDLILPSDLGIPISLLNVERYVVPPADSLPPLEPEDQALLGMGDDKASMFTSPASAAGPRVSALRNTHVSWLMRTTYIAQDSDAVRKPGYNEKKAKSLRQAAGEEEEGETREQQIAAIEAAFEAAQRPPVHSTKPELTAVEILPVLPDIQCWANKYVQAHFDNDPTEEVERLVRLPARIRGKVAARSMLKGFKVDNTSKEQEGQQADRFMALVVPEHIPESLLAEPEDGAPDADDAEVDPAELEGDYTWSKEYVYELKHRREQDDQGSNRSEYFIRFRDGVAAYCDIHTRLELKKRGEQRADAVQPARPAKVIITRRPPTEAEELDRARKMRRLHGLTGEDAAEDV